MGRYAKLKEEVENLKVCIAEGHKYIYVGHCRGSSGEGYVIEWKCRRCGFGKSSSATKEQNKILDEFKTLKPEKV